MSEIDYAARVAKGAALLDEKRPGWERSIDLDALDIQNPWSCVTAQLSGVRDFRTGAQQLGLDSASYVAHGFNIPNDCDCCATEDVPEDYDEGEAYATLNTLWEDLISKRLAPEPAEG